jgi:hypothetical protein
MTSCFIYRDSPFLRGSLFRSAELVACSITVGGELTAGARAAASDALARLTNVECVQVITAPPADIRAARDVVEVRFFLYQRRATIGRLD